MFIAVATINLKDINVFDKVISFNIDTRFIARDGILHEQIKAGNIKIIKESNIIKNEDIKDYIIFESEENKNIFDNLLTDKKIENKINNKTENKIKTTSKDLPNNTKQKNKGEQKNDRAKRKNSKNR